jgi:signal transduction histidine kinase
VEVEDDGRGFDSSRAVDEARGLGLLGIRERATHLGGHMDIYSAPGRGTRMIVDLPAGAAGG